jgi:hypothetical protein
MARLDIAGTLANAKAMLAGLTSWQAICGVSTSTEAARRIYFGGVFDEYGDDTQAPLCILQIDPLSTEWNAGTSRGRLTIGARFDLAMPAEHHSNYQAQYVWVWQALTDLTSEINSSVGGSGQLMLRSLNVPQDPGPINPDENQGRNEWAFRIDLVIDLL